MTLNGLHRGLSRVRAIVLAWGGLSRWTSLSVSASSEVAVEFEGLDPDGVEFLAEPRWSRSWMALVDRASLLAPVRSLGATLRIPLATEAGLRVV